MKEDVAEGLGSISPVSEDLLLPDLREDIQLLPGPAAFDGSPTWTIFDPVRNRYFKIGWSAFQLLSRWTSGSVNKVVDLVRRETTSSVLEKDAEDLIRFLYVNNLTRNSAGGTSADYHSQFTASRPNWFKWGLQNYLFLRIPLVRPNAFLKKIVPYLEPVFTNMTRNIILILGLIGIFLVTRQWDAFVNTFIYFFNLEGALLYVLALVLIKILHELGHALTATRYGCKIPTMGVAFLVLFPVLFTDTTDAYRLTSRRQRLYIGAAGVLTEFYLALICVFLWSFLPDGALKSVAFIVATVSFSLTFFMNINPFMRFDGYYILSDWLGVENLQARSFALGRWRLREILFRLNDPVPEMFPRNMTSALILYAWSTWVYRFFLLLAIAFVVYYFFFKLLGTILFIVEIYIFIVMPIAKEFIIWWSKRDLILKSKRFRIGAFMLLCLLILFFVPWSSRVSFPAIVQPVERTTIFAPAPGRIVSRDVEAGDEIKSGDVLVVLESPRMDEAIQLAQIRLDALNIRLQRIVANREDLFDVQILYQQVSEEKSRLLGLSELNAQLVIRSPFSGTAVEVADSLHPGRWINESLAIAYIVRKDSIEIEGMLAERDLGRISASQIGLFVPDDIFISVMEVVVDKIEYANVSKLESPYFASIYGGEIAVRQDRDSKSLVPETPVYRIRLQIRGEHADEEQELLPGKVIRGQVNIEGEAMSFAVRVYKIVASVLIRGSGF
jgi:putative peptide zinc metalloprotease protein